jgi:hypothetical protein
MDTVYRVPIIQLTLAFCNIVLELVLVQYQKLNSPDKSNATAIRFLGY